MSAVAAEVVARAAQLACLIDATAPKPGNVSPGHPFADMSVDDFLLSAAAIGPAFRGVGEKSVGRVVLDATLATRGVTAANTNLGMVLLLAPLARAACYRRPAEDLRDAARRVLHETTVEDARLVYEAIRVARPGGLGRAQEQDVATDPTVTLVDAMRLAAHRDLVAYEYAHGFEITFEVAVPTLSRLREDGCPWRDATVQTFLTVLAARPDTHIARRAGAGHASEVSAAAAAVLRSGEAGSVVWRAAVARFDHSLRDGINTLNPGTTADLTTGAVFVRLLQEHAAG
jgi:triphosphoribosyl-dephospho-CoA synthase